jgi:hypothetical protein
MKRFLSWIRLNPEPEPVQDDVLSTGAQDPLRSSKVAEEKQKNEGIGDAVANSHYAVTKICW